jgi:hypothetical protein
VAILELQAKSEYLPPSVVCFEIEQARMMACYDITEIQIIMAFSSKDLNRVLNHDTVYLT